MLNAQQITICGLSCGLIMTTRQTIGTISRRQWFAGLMTTTLISLTGCADAVHSNLETIDNLQTLGQNAQQQQVPILLFVTAPDCRYCHQLERDVIAPMLKNPRYAQGVIMRRLNIAQDQIIDFDGSVQDPIKVASRYRAQMTPTILFLAPAGNAISDKIQGVVQDIDQYGGMIDARLNEALAKLGNAYRIRHDAP